MNRFHTSRLDRSQAAAPQISAELRQRILGLRLKPNEAIARQDLQVEFGVSLTPVRDALLQLAEEGLIKIYPQAGTYVAPISISRAFRGHFLRSALEFELVRRLAEEEDGELVPALRTIISEQAAITSTADFTRFEVLDRRFHWTLFRAGKMEPLWDTTRRLSGDIDRLRSLTLPRPGKMEAIISGHTAVVDKIEARSAEGAYLAMRGHLSETLSLAEEVRLKHPDFFVE